jgi:hypothetical protein
LQRWRSVLIRALDWIALAFLVMAAVVVVTGGFSASVAGVRVTAHGILRPVLIAVVVMVIRAAISGTITPLGTATPVLARVRRFLYDPSADAAEIPAPANASRDALLAALGFCAFAAFLLHPQLKAMDSVPDLGDPLFSMWRTGWLFQQLRGDPRGLFDANIFHPEKLTLTLSDAMLWPSLTSMPLLALGVHPVAAYNALLVASFLLSAFTTYLLVRRLTGSSLAGFVSGLVFGFYPYRFEHYSHFELQMTYFMPLALLALHRLIATGRLKYAVLAALCGVGQLYSSMYYAVFFLLYAGTIGLLLSLLVARDRIAGIAGRAALAGAVAALLAVPLARPYLASQELRGVRGFSEVRHYSAMPADFLRAHPRSIAWGSITPPGRQEERSLFPGLGPLVLSAVGLVPPVGPVRIAYLGGMLVAFDASLGLNGALYRRLYEWFLPVRGMRVPARFSILVGLSLAVLSGFGVRRLLARASPARAAVTMVVLVGGIALDFRPELKLEPVWPAPPPVYEALGTSGNIVLAELPFDVPNERYTPGIPYMYFSLWHWKPIVNGYSGNYPRSAMVLEEIMQGFPDERAIGALKASGVTHVTVNCALYVQRNRCAPMIAKLDTSPQFRQVMRARWQGFDVVLYELNQHSAAGRSHQVIW